MIIDCDANATYLPDERIRGVIAACLRNLGNPSSLHRGGQRAKAAVEEARASIRRVAGAAENDVVVFTSGATEANNTVIASVGTQGGDLLSAANEHPCVLAPLARHAERGGVVHLVRPDQDGVVSVDDVVERLTPTTTLISIMIANNEVGTLNPISEIVREVRRVAPKAIIHTDAAQMLGKGTLSMRELGVDVMTVSAHKIGALTGTGAMIIRHGVQLHPLILGGPQEGKVRGGTENVLGVSVFGAVADLITPEIPARVSSMAAARDAFEEYVVREIPDVEIHGARRQRLPNTSSLYIKGVRADDLIVAMDLEGILISSGAACSSGKPEPSHVLVSMGYDEERTRSTIRVSFRADAEREIVAHVASTLARIVERIRSVSDKAGETSYVSAR